MRRESTIQIFLSEVRMDEKIKEKIRRLREQYGIPTAEKGVPLFRPGIDEQCMATIYPSNDIRALGFKSAADKLVNVAVNEPGYADYLVYPVLYLYRMYIELRLKTILEGAEQISRTGHKLEQLWKEVKPLMEGSSQWFDDQELAAVEEKIREFCIIDPFSDAARYATNLKGEPTLQGMQSVDLKHLKQVMDSLSTSLEGCYTAIIEDSQEE
jgi:hypothetical protein